jgi:hypothetical protein
MDYRIALATVIVLALMLATAAGFLAAKVLMHAARRRSPHGGGSPDR